MPRAFLTMLAAAGLMAAPAGANDAHDRLSAMSAPQRDEMLSRLMTASNEPCAVTRSFFQGFSPKKDAFWNVECRGGRTFSVMISNDVGGSTRILSCAMMKAVANVECFKKL